MSDEMNSFHWGDDEIWRHPEIDARNTGRRPFQFAHDEKGRQSEQEISTDVDPTGRCEKTTIEMGRSQRSM
jgi:hypothetical protein